MRITVDLDTKNPINLFLAIAKGMFVFGKIPHKISVTYHGFHLFWYNVNCGQKAFLYRKFIGDDIRRIYIDMTGSYRRIKQVMFRNKEIEFKKGKHYTTKERILYDIEKHKKGNIISKLKVKNPKYFR